MSKLTQAIKKISGYYELRKLIDQLLKQKPDILSERGVAYAVDGGIEAAKRGIDNSDGDGNDQDPHNPPKDGQEGDDDSDEGDNSNDSGGGSYCAQELIDATVPAGTDINVAVNEIGCITDVAATVAGEAAAMTINTDGLFRTPSTWTPGNPQDPADDYVAGFRWIGTASAINGGSAIYTRYDDAVESMRYSAGAQGLMGDFYDWVTDTPEQAVAGDGAGSNAQRAVSFNVTRLFGAVPADNFSLSITSFRCDRAAGLGSITGAAASCSVNDSGSSRFPREYNGQLVLDVDRKLRSSPYDQSQFGNMYREGVSAVAFNFDGGRTGYFEVGRNDTFLLYELDTAVSPPVPKGDVLVYDSNTRKLKERINGSLINNYPDLAEKHRVRAGAIRRVGGMPV